MEDQTQEDVTAQAWEQHVVFLLLTPSAGPRSQARAYLERGLENIAYCVPRQKRKWAW